MKILFTVTVLIAGMYLFIQQEGYEKISQYLPQNQMDEKAETLLTNINQKVNTSVNNNVDNKIAQLKKTLLAEKNERIDALEKQVARLQTQFTAQKLSQTRIEQEEILKLTSEDSISQDFPNERTFAQTQYITGESSEIMESPVSMSNVSFRENNNNTKQKAIKRQANLQDIAARMNKTSLIALTH